MSTKKQCWSQSFGGYGSTIRVAERRPGGKLSLFWIDNQGNERKRALGHSDRVLAKKIAQRLTSKLAGMHGAGHSPRMLIDSAGPVSSEVLTLAEGAARALDPVQGLYPTQTKHAKEARRLADRAVSILGGNLTWGELTPGKMRLLVRTLARESVAGRGVRSAEYMCAVMYAIAEWLRGEGAIPENAAVPKKNWKTKLREEWRAITGYNHKVERPRHTISEVRKIFAALPKGDARLRLLIELAAELRAGQAVRAKRTDLVLDAVGGYRLGRFVVHGAGKKHGETVDFHPEVRALVDEVLGSGYLAELEAAYQRGEIANYQVFPAGKLRKGKVPLERGQGKFLGPKRLRTMFHRVEELAGVAPRVGRAFYGLRRQATDLAPSFNQDARVLNRLSGHLDSMTRERIYQDPENERVLATTARARRQMRLHIQNVGRVAEPAIAAKRDGAVRNTPKHAQGGGNGKSPPA